VGGTAYPNQIHWRGHASLPVCVSRNMSYHYLPQRVCLGAKEVRSWP